MIKLCRPAMETNLDSVLDRIRVLEQRMEERPVQQVIVQQGNAGSVTAVPESMGAADTACEACKSSTGGSAENRGKLEDHHRTDHRYVQTDAAKIYSQIQW